MTAGDVAVAAGGGDQEATPLFWNNTLYYITNWSVVHAIDAKTGKKLWKQKHTGRARIGAVRSPLWKGGGTIFGPQPRDYSSKLPKKVRQLARKSALNARAREESLFVIDSLTFDAEDNTVTLEATTALTLKATLEKAEESRPKMVRRGVGA